MFEHNNGVEMNTGHFFTLKKSFLGFFLILLVLGAIVNMAISKLIESNAEVDLAGDKRYQSYLLANEVIANSQNLTRLVRLYATTAKAEYEDKYWDVVNLRAGKIPRKDGRQIALDELLKQAGFTDQEFAMLTEAGRLSAGLVETENKAMHLVKGMYPDSAGQYTVKGPQNLEMARDLVSNAHYEDELEKIRAPIDKFMAMMEERTAREEADAYSNSSEIGIMARGMLLMMLLISMGVLLWLYRLISKEINRSLAAAEKLAQGDLTAELEINRGDELGKLMIAINGIGQGLDTVVSGIRVGVETINVAAKEIATGNTDLSNRTESQASSLEETASSMEELTSTVKQNADNARQANQLVTTASDLAVKGGEVVGNVVQTMASIKESSGKIADIISVIDGIAFQTNILALNAAVEAARAGEQGRGFAVVASEVRTLAQRSATAAKEITDLINDSGAKVEAGSLLVDRAGDTMSEIVKSVKHVADIMAEITAASDEQSQGISQVGEAVTQIDDITQQNAALVEQAAAAAESLLEQSGTLAEAVKVFKTKHAGGAPRRPEKEAPMKPAPSAKVEPVMTIEPARARTPAPKLVPADNKKLLSPAKKKAPDGESGSVNEWDEF